MKSNIEKVYSKLPKTELATQKVELGIADDIAKMNSKLLASISDADGKLKEFKDAKDEFSKAKEKVSKVKSTASKSSSQYEKIADNSDRVFDKALKAAEDLGVPPSSIKGLTDISRLASDLLGKAEDMIDFKFD